MFTSLISLHTDLVDYYKIHYRVQLELQTNMIQSEPIDYEALAKEVISQRVVSFPCSSSSYVCVVQQEARGDFVGAKRSR